MKKVTGIVFGAILIACGVCYALEIFEIANIDFSPDGWWTLFIIVPCISGLVTDKEKLGSLTGIAVGILLLLAARGVFEYSFAWQIIAVLITVVIGIKLIVKSLKSTDKTGFEKTDGNDEEVMAVFGGKDADFTDREVSAAKIGAIFGGAKCNLSNADIKDGSRIDLVCIFGGADVILPEDVILVDKTFCLFGGISDKRTVKNNSSESKTVYINGLCLFGGADIKN